MGILRILLAIAVVITHSDSFFGVKLTGGLVAVEVFFIISGFYMTMILEEKYTGKGSYKLFLSNRFLRLYPMFWGVLSLTVLASIICYAVSGNWLRLSPYQQYVESMTPGTLLYLVTTNLALFGQDVAMFLGLDPQTGKVFFCDNFGKSDPQFHTFLLIPQAWTLGIEVTFYLLAPLVVRKSNAFIIAAIMASLSIRMCTYLLLGYTNDPWTYRFFPSELALFLLGTVSYRLYKSWQVKTFFSKRNQTTVTLAFVSLILMYQFIPWNDGYSTHLINWSIYAFATLSLPFIFHLTKSSRLDRRIGELSYPVYICHMLVISAVLPLVERFDLETYLGEFTLLLTLVASYALVRVIADPIEKIRQARVKKSYSTSYQIPKYVADDLKRTAA